MSYFPISIFDMHDEKDYSNHYNEFVHTLDFEISFRKNCLGMICIRNFK